MRWATTCTIGSSKYKNLKLKKKGKKKGKKKRMGNTLKANIQLLRINIVP